MLFDIWLRLRGGWFDDDMSSRCINEDDHDDGDVDYEDQGCFTVIPASIVSI